jgi:hypothetical protein
MMSLSRKRVHRIAFWILIISLILFFLFAYLRYIDLKKTIILKISDKAKSMIGQGVHIEDLSISPSGTINFYGITIKNPEGFVSGQLLRIKKLRLDMRVDHLLKGRLFFKNIVLYSPELTLLKDRNGRLNISDALMRFLSEKSTTQYQVDELRIDSGVFDYNRDGRYRSDHIHFRLGNLSPDPSIKTKINGTVVYAGNRIEIDGLAYLNDIPKRFNLSLSSKDFILSTFKKPLETYKINTEKARINIILHAEGDTEKGFHITSDLQLREPGFFPFSKEIKDIRLRTDAMFNLRDHSLIIQAISLFINGVSTATLKGMVTELKKNPSYRAEIKIDRLDLSELNMMKDLKVGGIITSNHLRVAGVFESKMPKVLGDLRLREGVIESPYGTIEKINADLIFSLDNEISVKGESLARVVKAGKYFLAKPVDVRLSTSIRGTSRQMDVNSFISLSPLEIKFEEGETVHLDGSHFTIEGTMKGETFSGRNSLEIKGIRLAGRYIPWLKSGSSIDYQKAEVALKNLTIETEDLKSSVNHLKITMSQTKNDYDVEIKGVDAAYRNREVLIKQCDLYLDLHSGSQKISGDFRFSTGNIVLQGIPFNRVTGNGRFDEKTFSVEVTRTDFSEGRIRFAVDGRISENPFPIKAKFIAEGIDLSAILNLASKSIKLPYHVTGEMKKASFEGTINSLESLKGHASVEARKVSILNPATKRNLAKDVFLNADIEFIGKDLAIEAEVATGTLSARLSGRVKKFMGKDKYLQLKGTLNEVRVSDIRNSFWDIFPDSFLYVGLKGSISSNVSINYDKVCLDIQGNLFLKDFILEGENGEYSVGPINGTIPIRYGKDQSEKEVMSLPSFEKSQFDHLSHYYAQETMREDLYRLNVGSLRYGFPLLENITLFVKQKGSIWNIERFNANIFGGKIYGSAIIDLSNGFHYRAGLLVKGMSLRALCDGMEPIKGFISGRVDGIASFRASGIGMAQLMGVADFWTYSTESEKTMISKKFLQKIGGPSLKSYLRDRHFDKGIISLYLKDEYLIFKELEISNRNLLGITDLSVKVAPINNRIALDQLLWTIVEAAERVKKKK